MVSRSLGHPLDGLGDGDGRQGRAVARAAAKTASMISAPRHGRAASWIATNSQRGSTASSALATVSDRSAPALDHPDIHEGDAGAVAALEQLAILGAIARIIWPTSSRLTNGSTARSQTARPSSSA